LYPLQPGDTVGVVRREDNSLYFTLNGTNLGLAVQNLPDTAYYGVLDLYGQAAEASIVIPDGEYRAPDKDGQLVLLLY